MSKYAVVISEGRYGSGETVQAERICETPDSAIALAEKLTRTHQAAMRRYGHTSGGYRAIETDNVTTAWPGYVLDRIPTLQPHRVGRIYESEGG